VIRRGLAEFGRWIEGLVAPAPQVQFGVDEAREAQQTHDADELMAFFNLDPAAADAAGTGPGEASVPPTPSPGQPDPVDQADAVRLLIEDHYITSVSCDTVCACGQWRGHHASHADHVADVVSNMLTADARMAAATNKFRS
jgi:hypothetical protein